jgi:hypothetical protein
VLPPVVLPPVALPPVALPLVPFPPSLLPPLGLPAAPTAPPPPLDVPPLPPPLVAPPSPVLATLPVAALSKPSGGALSCTPSAHAAGNTIAKPKISKRLTDTTRLRIQHRIKSHNSPHALGLRRFGTP